MNLLNKICKILSTYTKDVCLNQNVKLVYTIVKWQLQPGEIQCEDVQEMYRIRQRSNCCHLSSCKNRERFHFTYKNCRESVGSEHCKPADVEHSEQYYNICYEQNSRKQRWQANTIPQQSSHVTAKESSVDVPSHTPLRQQKPKNRLDFILKTTKTSLNGLRQY